MIDDVRLRAWSDRDVYQWCRQRKKEARLVRRNFRAGIKEPGRGEAVALLRFHLRVMMATPVDLKDFGIGFGFSITEGIIARAEEICDLELVENELGIEMRMWLYPDRAQSVAARRRAIERPGRMRVVRH